MSKTDRAAFVAVMEALKKHSCISSYTIDSERVRPEWLERGFERAFEEFRTSAKPLGLKKKKERACLCVVLVDKDKTVSDFLISDFKQGHPL